MVTLVQASPHQKVTVVLDPQGIPEMGDVVTQSVINAVCHNFNELRKRGLVIVKFDYSEPEYRDIFADDNTIFSTVAPHRPTVSLIPQNGHGTVLQVVMPK